MTARAYNLDTDAAKEANNGGKRITEPGQYEGVIRAAWYECNDKGTESVNLIFDSNGGQSAGPLVLYTHNSKGEPLPSYKMLNAIMACCKVRALSSKPGKVTLWDFDAQKEVERTKEIYPELVGAKVGLVLQGEEYENRDGAVKVRMVIAAPFEAGQHRMADEVLTKATDAKALPKFMEWFAKNPIKKLKGGKPASQQQSGSQGGSSSNFADDDLSDIPF